MTDHTALVEFARWAISEGSWEGCDLDGGQVQDKAEQLGLIVKRKYDPAVHGEKSSECDPGDDWYVYAPILSSGKQGSET